MRDIPPYESGVVFLPCADPGRTEAFYHDLLGLPVAQRQGEDVVIFDTGRGYWGFCRYADGRAPLSGPKGACLSLNLESAEAVDAVYQALRDRCPVVHPPRRHPLFPVYSFFVTDPDGYLVEFQKTDAAW